MSTIGMYVTSDVDPWAVEGQIGLRDARMAFSALLAPAPHEPIDVRAGVLLSGDSEGFDGSCHTGLRVQAAQSMSLTVEPGNCVIATEDGPYICTLNRTARLHLEPASRYMNRIDLVVARVYDDISETLLPSKGRHFCIEVWTGDPSPTTPVAPEPDGIGWIPLAQVRVQADTTQITAEQITDLRGPGLATRGGLRVLHGRDARADSPAFRQPGAFPGEQRWVTESAFAAQVWQGGGEDRTRHGWHGVHNAATHTASPGPGDWLWLRGGGALREVCSVTIPDPGVPYSIYPTGRVVTRQSPNTAVDVHIKVHDPNTGPAVNWTGYETGNTDADSRHVFGVPPLRNGPFTGEIQVFLTVQVIRTNNPEFGAAYRGDDVGDNLLSVEVWPLSRRL
ncbi:hypothetical protein E1161_13315 [Saccharopolyspora aridisoli]|uniref:Uncharacterized protein n=1 Tax=Saccharopolyspora aridisoli TaxID=2530385 RepID=A0A4R4UK46_9PSEU|nr:hypothetical protein [Saccharopolyspora aridisoli]TDC92347.1 hypothetical protein E1161_13315 [Saccharopolyspora aridisoli]